VSAKEVKMAEALVDSLSADFEPDKYHDQYREQVLGLIEKKSAGEEFEVPAAVAEAPKVVDLMAALEASVAAAKDARGRHPTSTTAHAAAKRTAAKRTATKSTAAKKKKSA
jgi:DNA end-binding protein Ku